jgi:uncharacterized membrane protein YjfL (UPF0719 family)
MKRLLTLLAFAPLTSRAATSSEYCSGFFAAFHPVFSFLVFAALGIVTAIVGYRLFDRFTPGDLHKEIIENKNTAAAIIGASVILGVSIIVAASIVG